MMRHGTKLWIIHATLALMMTFTECAAQTFPQGTRNFSMGGADISNANDVTSIFENPATLASLRSDAFSLSILQRKDGTLGQSYASPLFSLSGISFALATDVMEKGYPGSRSAVESSRLIQLGDEIAAAAALSPYVSVGGMVGAQYGKTLHSGVWGANFSAGLNYAPSSDYTYSLTLNNLGRGINFVNVKPSEMTALPYDDAGSWQIGATMRYPTVLTLQRHFVTLGFAAQKYFDKATVYYKAGAEIIPYHFLAIRFGYLAGAGAGGVTAGFGLSLGRFQLDYGIAPVNASDILQMISVEFDPGGPG